MNSKRKEWYKNVQETNTSLRPCFCNYFCRSLGLIYQDIDKLGEATGKIRAGALALRAEVEGDGLVQPGLRTASRGSHSSVTLPTWRVIEELS